MIFKYKAYDNLLIELGRNDYVVEIVEIATKDFLAQTMNSTDPAEFIKSKCDEFGIMVSYDKSNNFYNQITLSHIASVYHHAETFLYEFQIEYNSFAEDQWKFDKNKTKLDQTLMFFKTKNRFNQTDKIDDYLVEIFEYYHQLRVFFSHKSTTSEGELRSKWNKAISHFQKSNELSEKYRINNGPKDVANLDFEDYFLFTQVSKEICLKLSSICYPDPKGLANISGIKSLKKHADPEIRRNRIENYLKTNYGYIRENDSDKLVDEIENHL